MKQLLSNLKIEHLYRFIVILAFGLVILFLPAVNYLAERIENDRGKSSSATFLNGIDVSHYQGEIDWAKVSEQKLGFAFVKATGGISYVDPSFSRNIKGIEKIGLIHGAYHFFYPWLDPEKQAKHFLKYWNKLGDNKLPPVVDIELVRNMKSEEVKKSLSRWIDYIEKNANCKPIIYTYSDFYDQNIGAEFREYALWLADYAKTPSPPKSKRNWVFWQHSSKGRIGGIEGDVDLDVFQGNHIELEILRLKCAL